jgi:predicted MFS family arabinose efflux permease
MDAIADTKTDTDHHPGGRHWTHAHERALLITLAVIQFTTIVDFLIIIPLEHQYTIAFHLSPREFSFIIGSYAISAGISGLAAGFFLDRFDRKLALLLLFFGFAVGTLLCGLATTYYFLLAARFVAGAFGGVLGAVVLAIVGDVIPLERRGAAMGIVMSAFSIASVLGVPLGILAAHQFSWHMPFLALAALSLVILAVAAWVTPPLRGHLAHVHEDHPVVRTWHVMTHPDHQKAFLFTGILTCASFLVVPFVPAYMSWNIGFSDMQLALIYFFGGVATFFSMNLIGWWADRSGKRRVFTLMSLSTAVPILLVTNLPRVPVPVAIVVTTMLFVCMSGRFVPAMAMMTAVVEARYRGGFMSINTAVQQLAMGFASLGSGFILSETLTHQILHFPVNGVLAVACAYSCIYLAKFLKPAPQDETVTEPALVETM